MSRTSLCMVSCICMLILIVTGASSNDDEAFNDVFSQIQESVTLQNKLIDITLQKNLILSNQSDLSQMRQLKFKQQKGHIDTPEGLFKEYPVDKDELQSNYKVTTTEEFPPTIRRKKAHHRLHYGRGILGKLKSHHLAHKTKHVILIIAAVLFFFMFMLNLIRLIVKNTDVPKASLLQGLSLYFEFLTCVNATAIIPHSYFLVSSLGYSAVLSGILISSHSVIGVLSAYLARKYSLTWVQWWNRRLLVIAAFGLCVCTTVYAIAANPPTSFHLSNKVRFLILILSRLAIGPFNYLPSLLRMMAQKITPAKDLIGFNLYFTIAQGLGIGAGAFVATLGACTSSGKNDQLDAAITMWYMTALLFTLGTVLYFVIPSDIDPLIAIKEAKDAEHRPTATYSLSNDTSTISAQKYVWLHSGLFSLQRCLISSGLEAGAGMVFEVSFLLDSSDSGIVLGFTFVAGLPFCWAFSAAKEKGLVTAQTLLVGLTLVALIGNIFLFEELSSLWGFIAAIAVIFPAAFASNGFSNGLGMLHSIPGTFYSQENLMFLNTIVTCIGRFVAPPVSRALVGRGRNGYAIFQLSLAFLSCVGAFHIRAYTNEIETAKHIKDDKT